MLSKKMYTNISSLVFICYDNSEVGVDGWSNLWYSIFFKHLIRKVAVANRMDVLNHACASLYNLPSNIITTIIPFLLTKGSRKKSFFSGPATKVLPPFFMVIIQNGKLDNDAHAWFRTSIRFATTTILIKCFKNIE